MFFRAFPKSAFLFSFLFIALACDKESENPTPTANSKPTTPTQLKATATQTNIKLSWKASTDKDGKVASYAISHKLKTDKEYGKETTTTKTEHNITSLKADTQYSIRLRAKDEKGLFGDYATLPTVKTLSNQTTTTNSKPTSPTKLKATATKSSLKVSWTASTDPDGKVAGYLFSFKEKTADNYSKDTSLTSTTLTLTNLKPNTDYSVRLRAKDDQNALSGYATLTVKTLSNQPPTTPTNFKSTDTTLTSTHLNWTASTDPDGTVAAYLLSFKEKTANTYGNETTLTSTQYELTNLKPTTDYDIRLRAKDDQSALSGYATLAIKTLTPSPTTPSKPTSLTVDGSVAKASNSLAVKWAAAQAVPKTTIAGYELSYKVKGAAKYGDPLTLTAIKHTLSNLIHSTTYSLRVRAKNDKGEYSDYAMLEAATLHIPTTPPKPTDFAIDGSVSKTQTSLAVKWTAAQAVPKTTIAGYELSYKAKGAATYHSHVLLTATKHTLSKLSHSTTYSLRVRTKNSKDEYSDYATLELTTHHLPATPTKLITTAKTLTTLTVGWAASTDKDGTISSYALSYKTASEADYGSETTTTMTSQTISGLTENTTYHIQLRAKDNDGNWSDYTTLTASTQSKPTTPANLTNTGTTGSTIGLSWMPSTDSDGTIVSYALSYKTASASTYGKETNITTPHTLSGLKEGTEYHIRLRAKDDDDHYSDYATLTAQTPTPRAIPTTPTELKSTQTTHTSISVSWKASTDPDGSVASYAISYKKTSETSYSTETTTTTTTHTLTGLDGSTDYHIRVRAKDNDDQYGNHTAALKATTKAPIPLDFSSYGMGTFYAIAASGKDYLIVGTTPITQGRGWLVKVDKNGLELKNLNNYGSGSFNSITATSDGHHLVVGNTGDGKGWVVKVDRDGKAVKNLKNYGSGSFNSITATSDGNYLIAGTTGDDKGWVVKVDKDGKELKKLNGYGDGSFESITPTTDGNYLIAGSNDDDDGWVVKVDQNGGVVDSKNLSNYGDGYFISISKTNDDHYIITGIKGNGKGWVVKIDKEGKTLWNGDTYTIPNARDNGIIRAIPTTSGYLLCGIASVNNTPLNIFIMIDGKGKKTGHETDTGYRINDFIKTSGNKYLVVGPNKNDQATIKKIDESGNVQNTD